MLEKWSYFLVHTVITQIVIVLVTFPLLFVRLDCLAANILYPKLDTFSGMGDIFLSELVLIRRTLVIDEM